LQTALPFKPSALTDVTGFGLLGHLHEMAKGSALAIRLNAGAVPFLPETPKFAEEGFVPAGAYGNRKSYEQFTTYINDVDLPVTDLLFDPQTSGGLLFALDKSRADDLVSALHNAGVVAHAIGEFKEGESGLVEVCYEKNS
jgi:selenide,water dikinase